MTGSEAQATAPVETFAEVLESLIGETITMANPQSLEEAPVGQHITTSFYRAKILAVGKDYLSVATEYRGRGNSTEPVKQFIPLSAIKRISLMKSGAFLHL